MDHVIYWDLCRLRLWLQSTDCRFPNTLCKFASEKVEELFRYKQVGDCFVVDFESDTAREHYWNETPDGKYYIYTHGRYYELVSPEPIEDVGRFYVPYKKGKVR